QRVLQLDEPDRSIFGVSCLPTDAFQEEREPGHEITSLAREEQVVVVLASVLFEVHRQVEERLGPRLSTYQHEGDHEATDSAVSVQEGVDHLELIVRNGELYEEGKFCLVEESLEIRERSLHLLRRGWHEDRIVEVRSSDPHRARPQLPRETVLTTN